MRGLTTFNIGGPAEFVVSPENAEQAMNIILWAREHHVPIAYVGKGSDTLCSDGGVKGIVLHTAKMTKVTISTNGIITAECGVGLPALAQAAARQGYSGLEWAAGIPGSVGGSVLMNAGAYGGEMSGVVDWVRVFDGQNIIEIDDHDFDYRHSIYMENPEWLILEASFTLWADSQDDIQARMKQLAKERQKKQPVDIPSAGSFFKRPPKRFAGALIDGCGLKGYSIGGAQVSRKHAGFIVNACSAECRDVMQLAEYVRQTVQRQTGVELTPEVHLLGDIQWNF